MATKNPFNPNSIVIPTLFAGRIEQVGQICTKLERLKDSQGASFFVYGEKGIGKTALAKLILYIASLRDAELHDLNLLTSYYSVEKGQALGSVLQESLNRLTDNIEKNILDKIAGRVGDLLKNGKFQFGAFGFESGSNQKEKEVYTIKDQCVSILSNIVRSICDSDTENHKDGILIVIDEVHNVENIHSLASVLRNIITTLDVEGLGRVSFLLIGYKEDKEKFFEGDSSARRVFDPVPLGVMPKDEAADVLRKGFNSIPVKFDEHALASNIEAAGGYPHSIQILGHNLVESDKDSDVNEDDWDEAIFQTAMELRSKDFSKMYAFEKPLRVRDEVLIALAHASGPLTRKELDSRIKSSIYQHIDPLKKCGAIKEDEDKKLSLNSQLFRTAIIVDGVLRRRQPA